MSIEIRDVQSAKALFPMLFTLLGISMDVKLEQPLKAELPMLLTLLGIIVFLQPKMRVFVDVSIIALQLLRESYFVLPEAMIIEVRQAQLLIIPYPISVTFLPKLRDFNEVQPSNILLPIFVTLSGIMIFVKLLQP